MATGDLTDTPVSFLWDPSFNTWAGFGVRTNSSMIVLSPDLNQATEVFFGFSDSQQQAVLDAAGQLVS